MLKSIIAALIAGLLVVYLSYDYTNKKAVLKYTLSKEIPSSFLDTKDENIQQLIIVNEGNKVAKDIEIHMSGAIKDIKVIKFSSDDEVKIKKLDSKYEISYTALPIEGSITIVIKTSILSIFDSSINIVHLDGKAEKSSGKEDIGLKDVFWLIFVFIYLIFMIKDGFKIARESIINKIKYEDYLIFLERKKPFYLFEKDWIEIRKEYINHLANQDKYTSNIEEEPTYKILNNEKLDFISDEEWILMQDVCIKTLTKKIEDVINSKYTFGYEKLLLLKKPKLFPDQKWDDLEQSFNAYYIDRSLLNLISNGLSSYHITKELSLGQPKGLQKKFWDKFVEKMNHLLYIALIERIITSGTIDEESLKFLPSDEQKKLKNILYKKRFNDFISLKLLENSNLETQLEEAKWIHKEDYENILRINNLISNLEEKERRKAFINESLIGICTNKKLGVKPTFIDEFEWNNLKELEKNILDKLERINLESRKNKKDKNKNKKLILKLSKQLEIMNNFIDDPNSINRIEEYDNPFSKGNFDRLKKLADKLL